MKQLETPAIVVVVLYFVALVTSRVGKIISFTLPHSGWSSLQITLLTVPVVVISLAVHIAIAVWLYRVATREKLTPWVWAMFGFIFGVPGAILFFAVWIYEMMKARETCEQHARQVSSEAAPSAAPSEPSA